MPSHKSTVLPTQTRLPRYLALAYTALIVYASLHPFSGWLDTGDSPFSFLDAAWPRYWTVFDLVTNILAYLPLGFLLALALHRLPGRVTPAIVALLLGATISFCMETLQTWLPSRVPSNLDLACNSIGAALGALLSLRYGDKFFSRVVTLQHRLLAPIPHAELGLVLIALWLLTQLSPETFLFSTGDLRRLLEITPAVAYDAPSFFALESCVIACNMLAVGLIASALLSERNSPYLALGALFSLALLIRTMSAAILVDPHNALAWLTPGAKLGMLAGGTLLGLLLLLPASFRFVLAAMTLMAGAVLVNLTPPNPYSAAALATWSQGSFLNFNGATRLTASLWPFLTLPYLMLLGRRAHA